MFFKWFSVSLEECVCRLFLGTPAVRLASLCLNYQYLGEDKHEKQQFINMDMLLSQPRCIYWQRPLHPSSSLHNTHTALMHRYPVAYLRPDRKQTSNISTINNCIPSLDWRLLNIHFTSTALSPGPRPLYPQHPTGAVAL